MSTEQEVDDAKRKYYVVEIKKIETTGKIIPKQWQKISDQTGDYGYTNEVVTLKEEETTIFAQRVETLDLNEVIKAVNRIK